MVEAVDIDSVDDETLTSMDALICGAPTWHTGADERRKAAAWDEFLYGRLRSLDLSGKKVAIFGLGTRAPTATTTDAAGGLYDCFSARGATMVGLTATDDSARTPRPRRQLRLSATRTSTTERGPRQHWVEAAGAACS